MKIPFDSLTLCAVTWELQQFVGGKIQKISQPDDWTIGIEMYSRPEDGEGGTGMLLISCHAQWARAHLSTRRLPNQPQPPLFCGALRSRLTGGKIESISQIGFDRILEIEIDHPSGRHRIIAELMGKHSNIMLVDESEKIIGAAKWVGAAKTSRPLQPNSRYQKPPFEDKPPLFLAQPTDDLNLYNGASPFLVKLLRSSSDSWTKMRAVALEGVAAPVLVPEGGAYPISVEPLKLHGLPRASISIALEQHYNVAIPSAEAESLRQSILTQLDRVVLARDVAIADLRQAEEAGGRASHWQLLGELILAYGANADLSAGNITATNYDGEVILIPVNPEKSAVENANVLFDKAKKAKGRMGMVLDQIRRLEEDRARLLAFRQLILEAKLLKDLRELEEQAKKQRWLNKQLLQAKLKEDRPYQGYRVRELLGPGGWTVLFGENSEANDYLTLRIAKPNDLWLHVRGHTSAHVVIQTRNQPEKVGRELLEFAAKVAVQHSSVKHSGYVPVDYTLKKYVRRQHGAPKGAAVYTHEKTIHVDS